MSTWVIILCLRIFSLSRILVATFSPMSTFRANLTFEKFPLPRVRPSSYFPTHALPLLLAATNDDFNAIFFLSISLKIFSPSKNKTHSVPPKSKWFFSLSLFSELMDQDLFFLQGCHTWDFAMLQCFFVLFWFQGKSSFPLIFFFKFFLFSFNSEFIKKKTAKQCRFKSSNGSTNWVITELWIDKNWKLENWIDKIES